MYDCRGNHNSYFPNEIFRPFNKSKFSFSIKSLIKGGNSDIVILSHINLLPIGFIIKKFRPKTKLLLFAHGIEIWSKFGYFKRRMLMSCDLILSVSNYTSTKIQSLNRIEPNKCRVLNNCLDPLLFPKRKIIYVDEKSLLKKKHGFNNNDLIIFTLTRITSHERYKGYDLVLSSLNKIAQKFPNVKYVIAGNYDMVEKERLDIIAIKNKVTDKFILKGFVKDQDLFEYFRMADLYVMPSVKEGFGIVFIEAMYFGLPVIAGNRDGSVDALCNGNLGVLVDPLDEEEICNAIMKILSGGMNAKPSFNSLIDNFSYETYKKNVFEILSQFLLQPNSIKC